MINKQQQHSRQNSNTSSDLTSTSNMNNSTGSGSYTCTQNNDNISKSPNKNNSLNNKSPILFAKVNIQENESDSSLVAATLINSISPSLVSYKKIPIKDSDRTKDIKRLILSKFLMDPNKSDKYNLIQVFNNNNNNSYNELLINDQFNVYYAIKSVDDIQIVLRPKIFQTNQNSLTNNQQLSLARNQHTIFNNQLNISSKINGNSPLPPQATDTKKHNNWNLFKK